MTEAQTERQTIAIVGGTGPMGQGLALRWAQAGYRVVLGSRDAERAAVAAAGIRETLGDSVQVEGATNAEAVAAASTVALCVPFAAHARTLQGLRSAWREGSVLVDVTVPLAVAVGGRPTDMLGLPAGSAAEQAAQLTPRQRAGLRGVSSHQRGPPVRPRSRLGGRRAAVRERPRGAGGRAGSWWRRFRGCGRWTWGRCGGRGCWSRLRRC